MTTNGNGATWAEFAEDAPELADRIRARFSANLHHVIGTIRADGAPRLSGTEVEIGDDDVTIGMMPRSRKLEDVRRDQRVELHSAPLEEDLADGDAKLAGTLTEVPAPEGGVPGTYLRLDIELASLVQVVGDELVLTTWRPGRATRETRRR